MLVTGYLILDQTNGDYGMRTFTFWISDFGLRKVEC
jgi:hypothetical protein